MLLAHKVKILRQIAYYNTAMLTRTVFPDESQLQTERLRLDQTLGVDAKEVAERLG